MKRLFLFLAFLPLAAFGFPNDPNILVPESSIPRAEDRGIRAHTNHVLWVGPPPIYGPVPDAYPVLASYRRTPIPFLLAGPAGYHPEHIRAAYNLPATGGGNAIAVITAFHYPTALRDFNVFSRKFGLPTEPSTLARSKDNQVFRVVFADGKQPAIDEGWAQEAALDTQWSHAMAPNAKIYLVEARSNSYADLFVAVRRAALLEGVRQISMSWGGAEFPNEANWDVYMNAPQVTYYASSGDIGGEQNYPSVSRKVVGVGGTTLNLDANLNRIDETAWSGSGGGPSIYIPRPNFQNIIQGRVGDARGCPDLAFVADPSTGCAVYVSTPYLGLSGWLVFGGTSLSAPCIAGTVNLANTNRESSRLQNAWIYSKLGTTSFNDIVTGTAGSFTARTGWDFVTGVGTPNGLSGL